MRAKMAFITLWIVLAAAGLSACQPEKLASMPEQAVLDQAKRAMGPQATILAESIHVRQKVELDGKTLLLLTYDRVLENHRDPCLVVYETIKNPQGFWDTGLGDVICEVPAAKADAAHPVDLGQPLSVNGAWRKGQKPDEPGLSYAAGLVRQAEIEKVQVTWLDGKEIVVDVIDGSYLAVYQGAVRFISVQGLDKNGEVVYTFNEQAKR